MIHHPPRCYWCGAPSPVAYATGLDGYHHLSCGGACGYDLWTRCAA